METQISATLMAVPFIALGVLVFVVVAALLPRGRLIGSTRDSAVTPAYLRGRYLGAISGPAPRGYGCGFLG